MNDGCEHNHEPLIEGMDSLPENAFSAPKPSPELRERILFQTTRIVGRRSRRRRLAALTLVAAAYLLGITTAFLVWGPSTRKDVGEGSGTVAESPGSEAGEAIGSGKRAGGGAGVEAGEGKAGSVAEPAELVQRSESAPRGERVRLLKQAGDRYLAETYDVEKALACYRKVLDDLSPAERTAVDPEDTWLLAALKDSRKY